MYLKEIIIIKNEMYSLTYNRKFCIKQEHFNHDHIQTSLSGN